MTKTLSDSPEMPGQPSDNSESVSSTGMLIKLARWVKRHRFPILVVGHLIIFIAVFYIALVTRFETWFPTHNPNLFWVGIPLFACVKLIVFYGMRNFHGWWRYVTFSDLLSLAKAATMSLIILACIDYFVRPLQYFAESVDRYPQFPKTVLVIDWAFSIAALSCLRSVWRMWDEQFAGINKKARDRALLIGDNVDAAKLAHMINSRSTFNVKIVGLISQSLNVKTHFSDLRVVGAIDHIGVLCEKFRTKLIYVPAGELAARDLRKLIDESAVHNCRVNVIPKLANILKGGNEIPVRDVNFDDLLRRPPAKLNHQAIHSMVTGKTVMVTGAGGSIGSEICRQLLRFEPERLLLLGRGENRLYHIERELNKVCGNTQLVPLLANITDEKRMDGLFGHYRTDVVFHAAAHKHVPLTELNIGEAVINNVHGTRIIADAADRHGVQRLVLVSTDKSVNPTSIMGCTKQLAERYCLALGEKSETQFVATRFGNVLGSEGSVVPLFQEQIRRGGPITVTDERMTRFFMTIPEASQLVIQAGTMGRGGEIFVLEMGESVKIVELAHDLVRLAGLPANSIDIKFTGIRNGEKLYEELYYDDEQALQTEHEKILTAYHREFDYQETLEQTNALVDLAYEDSHQIRKFMKELVPEFISSNEQLSPAPVKKLPETEAAKSH